MSARSRHPFDAHAVIAGLRQGGPAAQQAARQLIAHCRPLLRARFFHARVAAQDMDDLLGEVLTAVVRGCGALRQADSFHAWLFRIADRELIRHREQQARGRRTFVEPIVRDADLDGAAWTEPWPWRDDSLSDPVLRRCLEQRLALFDQQHPDRRECIELLAHGLTTDELAQTLGRSLAATRQFASQCCAALMQALRPCLDPQQLSALKRGGARID